VTLDGSEGKNTEGAEMHFSKACLRKYTVTDHLTQYGNIQRIAEAFSGGRMQSHRNEWRHHILRTASSRMIQTVKNYQPDERRIIGRPR
jgi:hypothetical protein